MRPPNALTERPIVRVALSLHHQSGLRKNIHHQKKKKQTNMKPLSILCIMIITNTLTAIGHTGVSPEPTGSPNPSSTKVALINPFTLHIDPMERLLLINFNQDPDSVYVGFEPQVFNDPINGTGHLVIGWRVDGSVDVFHEPGIRPHPEKYDIAGNGLAHIVETPMETAYFMVNNQGVQVDYRFKDLLGREILLHIRERNRARRKPFGLLAPMGATAQSPSAMPLVMLHDFYFVRLKNTDLVISIDGRRHTPDRMPMPLDGRKMYFTRYSPSPLILTLNPAMEGAAPVFEVPVDATNFSSDEYRFDLEWKEGKPAIRSITANHPEYPVMLRFIDPFPHIASMKTDTVITGAFEITGHHSLGKITGVYEVKSIDGEVHIALTPSGGWKPRPTKLSLRILFKAAKVFTEWPKCYTWNATITNNHDNPVIKASWSRTFLDSVEIF
jgi:hypothetical protein